MHVMILSYIMCSCVYIYIYIYIHFYMLLFPLTQDSTAPLFVACQNGHSGVVNMLIRNGADTWLVIYYGDSYNVSYAHTV